MAKADYYETLGVARDADEKALKSAFRKLAMQYHPDRNGGDPAAEQKFKDINEAYETLKDPQKRAAYDRFGHAAFQNGGMGGGFGPGGPDFGASMADIFDDIFGEFMGGGRRGGARRGPQRGADIRSDLEITLEEAYAGKTVDVTVPTSVTCETCSGTGAKPGSQPAQCRTCGGHGKVRASQGFFTIERTCPACQGRGEIIEDPCTACSGQGRVSQKRTVTVNIPAGIEDGTRIRVAGEGEAGMRGAPPGDLYIFLAVRPHALFQREGPDLYCRVPISFTRAALGGSFEVPTLDGGKARVKVPEGTQTGQQFRLKGKGMPVIRSSQLGDLFVQVKVETPQKLTRRQKELLEEFEKESEDETNPEAAGFFARVKDFFDGFA